MRRRQGLRTALGAALLTLFALPAAPALAGNGVSDSTAYRYKVVDFSYEATGQLTAGRFSGLCTVGNALWQGTVFTRDAEDLTDLGTLGKGSLLIHKHGSTGKIDAGRASTSTLSDSFHRITTACMDDTETDATTTPCAQTLNSEQRAKVKISAGVGDHLALSWDLFDKDAAGEYVSDAFSCVEPLRYPDSPCTTKASTRTFTRKKFTLTFVCDADTRTPPAGSVTTQFNANAVASGSLTLVRTKQS
jgi:hypothetical protein